MTNPLGVLVEDAVPAGATRRERQAATRDRDEEGQLRANDWIEN